MRGRRLCHIAIRAKFRPDFAMNPISASGQPSVLVVAVSWQRPAAATDAAEHTWL